MTDAPTPDRVVLYCYANDLRPEKVAVFTWTADSGVSLTVVDQEWGALAREYFTNGIVSKREYRLVCPAEPETFMRALVQPSRSTYYRFVAEPSGITPRTGPPGR